MAFEFSENLTPQNLRPKSAISSLLKTPSTLTAKNAPISFYKYCNLKASVNLRKLSQIVGYLRILSIILFHENLIVSQVKSDIFFILACFVKGIGSGYQGILSESINIIISRVSFLLDLR